LAFPYSLEGGAEFKRGGGQCGPLLGWVGSVRKKYFWVGFTHTQIVVVGLEMILKTIAMVGVWVGDVVARHMEDHIYIMLRWAFRSKTPESARRAPNTCRGVRCLCRRGGVWCGAVQQAVLLAVAPRYSFSIFGSGQIVLHTSF
jgi:hypothetical protein